MAFCCVHVCVSVSVSMCVILYCVVLCGFFVNCIHVCRCGVFELFVLCVCVCVCVCVDVCVVCVCVCPSLFVVLNKPPQKKHHNPFVYSDMGMCRLSKIHRCSVC